MSILIGLCSFWSRYGRPKVDARQSARLVAQKRIALLCLVTTLDSLALDGLSCRESDKASDASSPWDAHRV